MIILDSLYRIQKDTKCPRGQSGEHFLIVNKETNEKFYLKPESRLSCINDRLAQLIISEIDLKSVPTYWCKYNEEMHIVSKFCDGLKRLKISDFNDLCLSNQKDFIRFIAINIIFDNNDLFGEIFLDSDNNIVALDFSDSILDEMHLTLLNQSPDVYREYIRI